MNPFNQALVFATTAHAAVNQTRKYTGEPYIVHPIEVAMLVRQFGGTMEMQIAALLHDTVEDAGVSIFDLSQKFGTVVSGLVFDLTEPETMGNRATRKAAECARLATISDDAQTIKLADLISNTRSIVLRDPDFARVYLSEKVAILNAMTGGDGGLRAMAWNMIPMEYR